MIDPTINFMQSSHESQPSFGWDEVNGDEGDRWEFVVDSNLVNNPTIQLFYTTILQCMFERVNKISSQNATEDDLNEFKFTSDKENDQIYPQLNESISKVNLNESNNGSRNDQKDLPDEPTSNIHNDDNNDNESSIKPNTLYQHIPPVEQPSDDWITIFKSHAGLFLFDKNSERFLMQAEHVDLEIVEAGRFLCELSLLFIHY